MILDKIRRCSIILIAKIRVFKYELVSDLKNTTGKPIKIAPVLLTGKGQVQFGKNVMLGVWNSPHFLDSYFYIEAREATSKIEIGDNVTINNSVALICDKSTITINKNTIIGNNFTIYDTDFHEINIYNRHKSSKCFPVIIGENVFIGSNVTILKGVTIGNNTVIASNSLVAKSIPANVVAGGVPCKILRHLTEEEMSNEII